MVNQSEIRTISRRWGIPQGATAAMIDQGVLDKEKALNGHGLIPEGYIRFSAALQKYELPDATLSAMIHRAKKVRLFKLSHKERYICEADLIAYLRQIGRLPPENSS